MNSAVMLFARKLKFRTPFVGPKKIESNGERRVRLTMEVWVKMYVFGQLCQGLHSRIFAKGFQGLSEHYVYWLLRLSCLFLQGRIRTVGCYHELD